MELKTVQMLDRIAKIDSEIYPQLLLEIDAAITSVYNNTEDDVEIEDCLKELGLSHHETFSKRLVSFCGFESDDEIASGYLYDYCISSEENRMEFLKKQLIEWAIELEDLEKKGL